MTGLMMELQAKRNESSSSHAMNHDLLKVSMMTLSFFTVAGILLSL